VTEHLDRISEIQGVLGYVDTEHVVRLRLVKSTLVDSIGNVKTLAESVEQSEII